MKDLLNEGNFPTWKDFKEKALEVSKLYNIDWLKTEYHHTVATSNMVAKWHDFQDSKDIYPNLKYVTVGDGRVRDKHKSWNGFIAPIDHPIWQKLFPPKDWGCRCDVEQTDEEPSENYETFNPDIKAEFANNPALSGKVFKETPYMNIPDDFKQEANQNIDNYNENKKDS